MDTPIFETWHGSGLAAVICHLFLIKFQHEHTFNRKHVLSVQFNKHDSVMHGKHPCHKMLHGFHRVTFLIKIQPGCLSPLMTGKSHILPPVTPFSPFPLPLAAARESGGVIQLPQQVQTAPGHQMHSRSKLSHLVKLQALTIQVEFLVTDLHKQVIFTFDYIKLFFQAADLTAATMVTK